MNRPRVLLAVADPILSDVTEFRLSLLGYDVQAVEGGNAAIQAVEATNPDLLIISADIRDMECVDVVEIIRTRSKHNDVPIILFSMESGMEAVRRAFVAGTNEYVITPYDPATLEAKIESLLHNTDKPMSASSQGRTP